MPITYRPGALADSFTTFKIFEAALTDLSERMNVTAITGSNDPAVRGEMWARRQPLFDHLARTAYQFWIAEQDGRAIGYARSILREDVLELTEFFIAPNAQSAGVGGELLKRAFPAGVGTHRLIVATLDTRAQVRYLKAGVLPRFPEIYWSRTPENVPVETDLAFERVTNTPETLAALAAIDRAVLGHTREPDHLYLLTQREAYLYRRAGQVVGYGYLAQGCGPIALLDPADFPAVLAHAERTAFERGRTEVGFDIPMVNRAAIDHVLARRYTMDSFIALIMTDQPFGKFENYILTSPAFFI